MDTETEIREKVRLRYSTAALSVADGCCGPVTGADLTGGLYAESDTATLPQTAVEASLGCGNPALMAVLQPGETVLDLGSGAGLDVLLSARRVGPTGRVIGLDMTEEMLALARLNAAEAGADNVEFRQGYIEAIPLEEASVDAVISNCVINLSADKPAVFAEVFRVLRPGGRIAVSDIVAENELSAADRAERGSWVGCIAGALSIDEYENGLRRAGFVEVSLTPTHSVADGLHSMIIRAAKP